jgi:glutamate racemase
MEQSSHPIGVFDSGFGGLAVLQSIEKKLPRYDYLYLGDNARTPYGSRSFDTVYQYTLQAVEYLVSRGCRLVIIACNTASARALRTIQQRDLPRMAPGLRVLGVIRPTTEIVGQFTRSGHVGVLATQGTVSSLSYPIEISHFFPRLEIFQHACPMWVPLVENGEAGGPGADYFVKKDLDILFGLSGAIDTIVLGCTHYPLLLGKISHFLPKPCILLSQGEIVARSLADYFVRHPEVEAGCTRGGTRTFLTTDSPETFDRLGSLFFGAPLASSQIFL